MITYRTIIKSYNTKKRGKLWRYEIRDGKGNSYPGKGGFSTELEAQDAGDERRLELKKGSVIAPKDLLIGDIFDDWYKLIVEPSNRAEATRHKIKLIGSRLKQAFPYKVATLTADQIQKGMNKVGKNAGIHYMKELFSYLRKVLNRAKQNGLLIVDIDVLTRDLEYNPKRKPRQIKGIDSENDYLRILKEAEQRLDYQNSIVWHLIYIAFVIGARGRGELAALKWTDLHQSEDEWYLSVGNRVTNTGDKESTVKTWVRNIPLSEKSVQILLKLKKEQELSAIELKLKNNQNLMFWHFSYSKVPTSVAINKHLSKFLEHLEIKKFTIYGARHSLISYLVGKRIPVEDVAILMGHLSETERRTYIHILKEPEKQAQNKFRNILEETDKIVDNT